MAILNEDIKKGNELKILKNDRDVEIQKEKDNLEKIILERDNKYKDFDIKMEKLPRNDTYRLETFFRNQPFMALFVMGEEIRGVELKSRLNKGVINPDNFFSHSHPSQFLRISELTHCKLNSVFLNETNLIDETFSFYAYYNRAMSENKSNDNSPFSDKDSIDFLLTSKTFCYLKTYSKNKFGIFQTNSMKEFMESEYAPETFKKIAEKTKTGTAEELSELFKDIQNIYNLDKKEMGIFLANYLCFYEMKGERREEIIKENIIGKCWERCGIDKDYFAEALMRGLSDYSSMIDNDIDKAYQDKISWSDESVEELYRSAIKNDVDKMKFYMKKIRLTKDIVEHLIDKEKLLDDVDEFNKRWAETGYAGCTYHLYSDGGELSLRRGRDVYRHSNWKEKYAKIQYNELKEFLKKDNYAGVATLNLLRDFGSTEKFEDGTFAKDTYSLTYSIITKETMENIMYLETDKVEINNGSSTTDEYDMRFPSRLCVAFPYLISSFERQYTIRNEEELKDKLFDGYLKEGGKFLIGNKMRKKND